MEKFVKGDVVVIRFPFSNLKESKRRPAYVPCTIEGSDVILCQITSQDRKEKHNIALNNTDFKTGSLTISSVIRANKIFTLDKSLITYKIGELTQSKIIEIESDIVEMFIT